MQMKLKEIARLIEGELIGNPDYLIEGAGPLDQAEKHQITFAEKGPALKEASESRAGAIIFPIDAGIPDHNLVRVAQPRLAFAKIVSLFYPPLKPAPGVHPTAFIGTGCSFGKEVTISPHAVIGRNVLLGDGVVVHPHVVLGDDVIIGDDTVIYPNVTILDRCRVGRRTIIHAGTVIGSDGYGFVQDQGRHFKMPQVGIVQIDDDVEIGANNTIDRATFGKTWIQSGVKTDNLVHIAHNVQVGEHTLIIAQAGIAGSSKIGRNVILAGQSAVAPHLTIGDGAIVGPQAGVAKSIPDGQIYSAGIGAMPHREWLRMHRVIPDLPEMAKKLRQLEAKIEELLKSSAAS
jgi:UDP-3-O-[3-hydroxymyristoyl] glucosamine N-acyltransferase